MGPVKMSSKLESISFDPPHGFVHGPGPDGRGAALTRQRTGAINHTTVNIQKALLKNQCVRVCLCVCVCV